MGRDTRPVIQLVDLHEVYKDRPNLYDTVLIQLDAAVDNRWFANKGDFFYVLEAPATLDASVRFNNTDQAPIPLKRGRRFFIPYQGFYLTYSAQAGQTMTLLLGKDLAFDFSESGVMDIFEIQEPVKLVGPNTMDAAASPVSLGAVATLIAAARSTRRGITLYNEGANPCRVGKSDVLFASKGVLLPAGSSLTLYYTGAIYGFVDVGFPTDVGFVDEYQV